MSLPNVSVGDPHAQAHNDERQAINELKELTETGRLSEEQITATTTYPTQLAVLSDSLWGYGEGVPTYVAALSKQRHRFTSTNGTNRVVFYPGQDTAYLLTKVADITGLTGADKPTHCIVQGGTNDVIANVAAATILANLEAIYTALEAAGIRPIISTLPPLGGPFQHGTKKSPGQRVNVLLRDLATRTGRWIVDGYDTLIDLANSQYRSIYDSGDNVHPNTAGIKAWAQRVIADLAGYAPVQPVNVVNYGGMTAGDGQLYAGSIFSAGGGTWGGGTNAGLASVLGVTTPPSGYLSLIHI